MKRIRLNTRFIAEEAVPELLTIGMIPFTLLACFCEFVHGFIDTTLCAIVFLLCSWSAGYREWQSVKKKVSKLHFWIFALSFLTVMACGTKLYAMTDMSEMHRLLVLALVMLPCILIAVKYNNAIHTVEKYEENDREQRIALAGYKALWTVVSVLLAYSACFWAVYYWGDVLSNLVGVARLESWQMAMHNMLD